MGKSKAPLHRENERVGTGAWTDPSANPVGIAGHQTTRLPRLERRRHRSGKMATRVVLIEALIQKYEILQIWKEVGTTAVVLALAWLHKGTNTGARPAAMYHSPHQCRENEHEPCVIQGQRESHQYQRDPMPACQRERGRALPTHRVYWHCPALLFQRPRLLLLMIRAAKVVPNTGFNWYKMHYVVSEHMRSSQSSNPLGVLHRDAFRHAKPLLVACILHRRCQSSHDPGNV